MDEKYQAIVDTFSARFAVQVQDGMVYLDATELATKATDLARPIAGPARRCAPAA